MLRSLKIFNGMDEKETVSAAAALGVCERGRGAGRMRARI